MNDWFKNLRAGDKVIESNYWGEEIKTVEKVTPTGIVKVDGEAYKSPSKWKDHHLYELRQATPDAVEAIKRNEVISYAIWHMRDWAKALDYDKAARIIEVMEPGRENP